MSLTSRQEYLHEVRRRYARCSTRRDKSRIIDEVVANLGYHRKYAIQSLQPGNPPRSAPVRRPRPLRYGDALPAIRLVWEALDYPCAERLHPVLLTTAEFLARHGELYLDDAIRRELAQISRSTLARRLAAFQRVKVRRVVPTAKAQGRLRREVPLGRLDHRRIAPGAVEIDLVEHNGGQALGHFAYTLNLVEVVSGFTLRRALLGKSQRAVFAALQHLLAQLPFRLWVLHSDNGSEFLNDHLVRFAKTHDLEFQRGRPYHKNDQPYVEQKNRQFVRELVGYERYDTPEEIEWLNQLYALFDPYANLFLPTRKLIAKSREGTRVQKRYDEAATPIRRLIECGAMDPEAQERWLQMERQLNPLALHRRLETLLALGPSVTAAPAIAAAQELTCQAPEPLPV